MFGGKSSKGPGMSGGTTLISRATEIVGDIHFSGTLIIEGKLKGNVYAIDGEDATAQIQENGEVEGEIRVPSLVINGKVIGDVYSSKHIELASKTVVQGNVHYVLIEMVKGAQVNGSLVYSVAPKKLDMSPKKKLGKSQPISQPSATDVSSASSDDLLSGKI